MKSTWLMTVLVFSGMLAISAALPAAGGEYLELLVATSDSSPSNLPREEWTDEMRTVERAGSTKQGYIIRVEPAGFAWGRLEKDPKRFAIVAVPKRDFDPRWLEEEQDEAGKPLTMRRWRLPLEAFLTAEELAALQSIPYNDPTERPAIRKTLADMGERIALVDWDDRPADLRLHGSSGIFKIRAAGGDYTSLSSWESAEQGDLTGKGPCIAECYNDWPDGLNDKVTISGWETTAADYIKIYTPASERHNGTAGSGFRMCKSGETLIDSREDNVTIEGLELFGAKNGIQIGSEYYCGTNLFISHNLIHDMLTSTGRGIRLGYSVNKPLSGLVFNNIVHDIARVGIDVTIVPSMTVSICNNTAFRCNLDNSDYGSGFRDEEKTATVVFKNNAAFNNLLSDFGVIYKDSHLEATQNGGSNNASSDGTGNVGLRDLNAGL